MKKQFSLTALSLLLLSATSISCMQPNYGDLTAFIHNFSFLVLNHHFKEAQEMLDFKKINIDLFKIDNCFPFSMNEKIALRETMLQKAIRLENSEAVRFLIKNNASLKLKNNLGMNAYDVANESLEDIIKNKKLINCWSSTVKTIHALPNAYKRINNLSTKIFLITNLYKEKISRKTYEHFNGHKAYSVEEYMKVEKCYLEEIGFVDNPESFIEDLKNQNNTSS